jgi:hypothetical protein
VKNEEKFISFAYMFHVKHFRQFQAFVGLSGATPSVQHQLATENFCPLKNVSRENLLRR